MILKRLLTSQTRVKLLTLFLTNPDEEYFIRELTRRLDEQINSIRRELDNLKRMGLLKSRMKNRKKFYIVDKSFFLFSDLRNIFLKCTDRNGRVTEGLLKIGKFDLILLSGFFIQKPSDIDLLLVGEANREELEAYLEKEVGAEEPIRFTLLKREDFVYRLKCNDRFMKELLTDPENLVAHNTLRDILG